MASETKAERRQQALAQAKLVGKDYIERTSQIRYFRAITKMLGIHEDLFKYVRDCTAVVDKKFHIHLRNNHYEKVANPLDACLQNQHWYEKHRKYLE